MRLYGFGLTTRYAVAHLTFGLCLLTSGGRVGESAVETVLTFPLNMVQPHWLKQPDAGPPRVSVFALGIALLVLNSYLWGFTLGFVHTKAVNTRRQLHGSRRHGES